MKIERRLNDKGFWVLHVQKRVWRVCVFGRVYGIMWRPGFHYHRRVAKLLRFLGFKPGYSTGIDGSTTCGYGRLDIYGFWQYPLK